jgi:hypothetical protein
MDAPDFPEYWPVVAEARMVGPFVYCRMLSTGGTNMEARHLVLRSGEHR